MAITKIEWTATHHADGTVTPGFTFNPWRGSTKVSAGCAHCYAETLSGRNPKTLGVWGPNGTRVVASESMWKEPLKWNRAAAKSRTRPRVFCASLADVFEDWTGPIADSRDLLGHVYLSNGEWGFGPDTVSSGYSVSSNTRMLTMQDVRERLFALIDATPNLDWLLLTKRPENITRMMPPRFRWVETGVKIWQLESPVGSRSFYGIVWGDIGQPTFAVPGGSIVAHSDGRVEERGQGERLTIDACKDEIEKRFSPIRPNLWLGVSVENQQAADERIPHLLRVPATVRFLSCEPLLGPVILHKYFAQCKCGHGHGFTACPNTGGVAKTCHRCDCKQLRPKLGWSIVGGESGKGARPCRVEWIRDIVQQCKAAGVPCFVKQLGSNPEGDERPEPTLNADGSRTITVMQVVEIRDRKGGDWNEWPADLRVREFPR